MKQEIVAITGVCGGIGIELLHIFIRQGSIVIGLDINQNKLNEISKIYPNDFISIHVDISKQKNVIHICKKIISEYGIPDIWINNAGIANLKTFKDSNELEIEEVINVNFISLFKFTHFWYKQMIQNGGGTIVNIASMAGYLPLGGMASYVASKHAIVGLTKSIQQEIEVEKLPVDLLLISPGFVETPIMKIGESFGFPKDLNFLVSSPGRCAQEIVSNIRKKSIDTTPTLSGKLLKFISYTPEKIKKNLSKNLLKKVLKKTD